MSLEFISKQIFYIHHNSSIVWLNFVVAQRADNLIQP